MEFETKTREFPSAAQNLPFLISAAQYNTSDPTSFAHESARRRWPVIITQGIDDVHRSIMASDDDEVIKEGKEIVAELAKLKYELQHDRELTPIPDDGEHDVAAYNQELEALGKPKWHSVPWLYSECYLYRYAICRMSARKGS
jgi:hypothetical protein